MAEHEPNQTQIHSVLTFECLGAVKVSDPRTQPKVNVVLEVRQNGGRKVSCPFLRAAALENNRAIGDADTQFYCTATPWKTEDLTFDEAVQIAERDHSRSPLEQLNSKFPFCTLKRPL